MGKNPNRIFNSEAELHLAVRKWDEEFSVRVKDRKFESYRIKNNPVAKALRTPAFRPRIVEDKTKYNRKRSKDV